MNQKIKSIQRIAGLKVVFFKKSQLTHKLVAIFNKTKIEREDKPLTVWSQPKILQTLNKL